MTSKYYHGYLKSHNTFLGTFSLPGVFPRVRVGRGVRWVGDDLGVEPIVVLLPGGRLLAGASLGVGMLTRVCLDVLPDRVVGLLEYRSAADIAWREAWRMAGEEVRVWAEQLAEEAAQYEALAGCSECGFEALFCELDDDGRCAYCVEAELEVCDVD